MNSTTERTTPLDERIRLHKPGQLTWPEPKLGEQCAQCRHFTTDPRETHRNTLPASKGICKGVYHRDPHARPVPFAANAIACSQFSSPNG